MTTVVVVVLVVLLLFAALRLWITANRLDRLHVRTEAAWSALEGALARRIVATRAVAAAGGLRPAAVRRAAAARRRRRQRRSGPPRRRRERPVPRTVHHARRRPDPTWPPNWPTPVSGWCWPGGSTTTRCATPGRCAPCCSPGCSGWPAGPRCPTTSRSPRTGTAGAADAAPRPGWCCSTRPTGCCCSPAPTRRWTPGGGSPPAAGWRAGRSWPTPRARTRRGDRTAARTATNWSARSGGGWPGSRFTGIDYEQTEYYFAARSPVAVGGPAEPDTEKNTDMHRHG